MARAKARQELHEGEAEAVFIETPAPAAAAAVALPVNAPIEEEVAIPLPAVARKAKKAKPARTGRAMPGLEELLMPLPRTPPHERQRCLALTMQTTGHSLDWGCRLCFSKCVYAAPCGCGGWDCIDRKAREPLVVFTETVKTKGRSRKESRRRARGKLHHGEEPRVASGWRLLKPWTWFRRRKAAPEAPPAEA